MFRFITYALNWKLSCLEHLEMLKLEARPFVVDSPRPWGKLNMRKVGLLTGKITYRAKRISP